MSEVEQVVSFLQRSDKGRLEYDRDWAASREGVERVLGELTLDFNQFNIDKESSCAHSAHISIQDEKEPSPDLLPNRSKTPYSPDSSTTRRINLNLSSEFISRTTSSGLKQEKTKLYKKEMRMSLNSSLDNKRSQKSGAKTSDSFITPEKFVRIRPVEVNVDRSMERNIDQKQFFFSPSSPHTPTTLLNEETEPVKSVNLSDSSVYQYTPGFLKKISKRNVSVNLVRLKLDSIRPFLNLEPEETKEEPEKEEEKVEEEEEDVPQPELEKVNKTLINIREQMSAESERKTAELIKKLNMKSRELSEQAELRYQEEKEEERRIMKEQEEAILEEIKRDREDALRRENEEKAADLRRKQENDELLRICKEQEDKIREEEEREKRIIEQTDKYEKLILHQIKPTVLKLVDVYNSVPDLSKLSEASQDAINIYDMFLTMVEDMKQKTRDGSADESDWENVISLEKGVKSSILILEENIIMLEQLAEKEKAEAAAAATKAKEAAEKAAAETATQAQQALKEVTEQKNEEISTPAVLSSPVIPSISVDAYRAEISDFKTKYIGDIVFSDQEKKIKSELMLAISTALNAISAQTTEHLNDKLEKLTLLLAGRPVVMKDTQICASQHPSGVKFCMAMAAKKIVRQGEEVVSSKAESAFPFASVALALWDSFPDFGKLLLAYFFEFCPLLVPYYPRRLEGQSDKDFYVALGYKYEKDAIEKQDKYLKRMTGLARLFAGIAASNKPQGSNTIHPFGPKLIWKFLAELMNQEPIPDVTATVLLVVLETTGNLMSIKYGAQFFKLLSFVNSCFLERLEAVKTDGGPTARLQTFLEKTLKEGKVDAPKGVLAPGFVKKVNI